MLEFALVPQCGRVVGKQFRAIDTSKESMQAGDILSWPHHMAIYGPNAAFAKDDATTDRLSPRTGKRWIAKNNIWTATNPEHGGPYHADELRYFMLGYKVYRYQRIAGGVCPS